MVPLPKPLEKAKLPPRHEQEAVDPVLVVPLWVVSHCFAIKVMCMGVVTKPCPEHGFDGRIGLLQAVEEREHQKTRHLENEFSHDLDTNKAMKSGWQSVAVIK